ncbi:G protein subunit beta [Malassezia psittaci]|uniref:G protein subunit beta n=1 Tax=Malassezia psittaci TaxID=1821823 RepID=A0AAF0FCD4_9BASI|nr:G protein subunit beta [Malassezia psittaci]
MIASGGLDNTCTIYDLRKKESVTQIPIAGELNGHTAYISACRFRGDREMLTGSGDGTCALWDVQTESRIRHFTGHSGDVTSLALSPQDPNVFVSGSCDTHSTIWDVRTSRPTQIFSGHARDVNTVDFFPDGSAIASGSDDATCRLYDLRANRELAVYAHGLDHAGVTSVAFSKSGRILVSASEDSGAQLWDTLLSERVGVLHGHDERIASVRVSPRGDAIATGGWDAKVIVWSG